MTEKERGNLLDFHEKARTKVEQTIMKREGADCDLWQAEAPELEPPPPTTALVCQPEPVDCSVAPRSDSP